MIKITCATISIILCSCAAKQYHEELDTINQRSSMNSLSADKIRNAIIEELNANEMYGRKYLNGSSFKISLGQFPAIMLPPISLDSGNSHSTIYLDAQKIARESYKIKMNGRTEFSYDSNKNKAKLVGMTID